MNELDKYHQAYTVLVALAACAYMDRKGHETGVTFFVAEGWAVSEVDSLSVPETIEWLDMIANKGMHLATTYNNMNYLTISISA